MARIESKIKRVGGSKIDIGGVEYHFKPASGDDKNMDVPHVCEVEDDEHLARFLSIPEGYKLVTEGKSAAAPAPAPAASPAPSSTPESDGDDSLAGMDDAAVRVWAKDKGLKVQGLGVLKGKTLRAKVLAAAEK